MKTVNFWPWVNVALYNALYSASKVKIAFYWALACGKHSAHWLAMPDSWYLSRLTWTLLILTFSSSFQSSACIQTFTWTLLNHAFLSSFQSLTCVHVFSLSCCFYHFVLEMLVFGLAQWCINTLMKMRIHP